LQAENKSWIQINALTIISRHATKKIMASFLFTIVVLLLGADIDACFRHDSKRQAAGMGSRKSRPGLWTALSLMLCAGCSLVRGGGNSLLQDATPLNLSEGGESQLAILIPVEARPCGRNAAQDLKSHIGRMGHSRRETSSDPNARLPGSTSLQ
jgi:hypothetical protein